MFYPVAAGKQEIVKDGLVLWLDANDKTSYPGSGNTWRDLTPGDNDGTLINGPTFDSGNGGALQVDDTDDEISGSYDWNKDNFTISWFINPTTVGNYGPAIALNGWGNFVWHSTSNGSVYAGTDIGTRLDPNDTGCGSGAVPTNTWQNWVCTFSRIGATDTGTFTLYKNGIYINQTTTALPSSNDNSINYRTYGNSASTYKISTFLIYSKTLSSEEVLQNYNATKDRFGL